MVSSVLVVCVMVVLMLVGMVLVDKVVILVRLFIGFFFYCVWSMFVVSWLEWIVFLIVVGKLVEI